MRWVPPASSAPMLIRSKLNAPVEATGVCATLLTYMVRFVPSKIEVHDEPRVPVERDVAWLIWPLR